MDISQYPFIDFIEIDREQYSLHESLKNTVFYTWLQKREPGKFQIWEEFAGLLLAWRLGASSSKGTAESCPTLMAVRKPALDSSCKEPNPISNLSMGFFSFLP